MFTVKGKIPQHRHQRNHRHRDRAGDDPHLGANGAGGHRTLRANVILDRHIVDNRQDGIHHVTGTAEDGQRAGDERRHNRDIFWVTPQQLLSNLQHDIQTAGCLQRRRGRHHRNDHQHHINRRFARLEMKNKDEDHQTDAAQQPQRNTAFSGTVKQTN